jgi:uncharacterized membrane protein
VGPQRWDAALDRLVSRGVLSAAQAGAVREEYAGGDEPPRQPGLRRQVGEIAGYLGASFVVGAMLLFLGEQWDPLGRPGRVAILGITAAVLSGAGVVVRRRPGDGVRTRLASTLLTGAADPAAVVAGRAAT